MIPERLRSQVDLVNRRCLLPLVFVLVLFVFGCAKHPPRNLLNGAHAGPMTASLSSTVNSQGISQPVVIVSIAQSALIFKQQGLQIEAGLTVSVSAFSGQDLVGGGVATKKITIDHWDAAASDSVMTVHVPLQVDSDGEVVLEVRARSLHSSRFWNRRLVFDAGLWWQVPFSLHDFSWDATDGNMIFQAQDSLTIDLLIEAKIQQNVPVSSVAEDQWWVALAISSQNGRNTYYHKQPVTPRQPDSLLSISFTLDTANLPFGDIIITPLLWDKPEGDKGSSPWINEHRLTNVHINFADNDQWNDQLEWLEDKAPTSALQRLSTGPAVERSLRWSEFWQAQGPLVAQSGQEHSPIEHLLLIVEADRRYSRSKPGSYSDRGRALIRYGIPDRIDKIGDSTRRDEKWETWIYQPADLKLIFHDPHGLNDFRLVEKSSPPVESN